MDELLAGALTREAASAWAGPRHVEQQPDEAVEEALDVLTLIDARHFKDEGDYLYGLDLVAEAREALLD